MCLLFCHLSEVPTAAGVTLNNVSSMYGVWHRKGNLSILLTQCPNSDLQATLSCMFSMLFCSTTPNLAQHQPLRRHFQWCSLKPGVFKHAGQCTLRAKAVCPPMVILLSFPSCHLRRHCWAMWISGSFCSWWTGSLNPSFTVCPWTRHYSSHNPRHDLQCSIIEHCTCKVQV